jgi:hypothetical protein
MSVASARDGLPHNPRRPVMTRALNRLAADSVMLLHFGVVLFAVLGGLLMLVNSRWLWFHLPVVLWSSVVNLASWTCPLTPIEQACRRRGGDAWAGGFVQHYVGSVVYPKGMPRQMELIAGVSILVWNAIVYTAIFV